MSSPDAKGAEPLAQPGGNGYRRESARPWLWVPTLYFVQGLPYVLVVSVSVVLYQNLELSIVKIAEYTSYLGLPWVIKPLWSPLVDVLGSKRRWILNAQVLMSIAIAAVGFAVTSASFVALSLAGFFLLAMCSATHDIAADGFYMQALTPHDQAFFVGIRNTAWRLAMVAATGLLVVFVGDLNEHGMEIATAWQIGLLSAAGALFILTLYHAVVLPRPRDDSQENSVSFSNVVAEMLDTIRSFVAKPGLAATLAFLLLYRFAEGQLTKIAQPFLLSERAKGGLGLTNVDIGWAYGVVGVVLLLTGGILGGVAASHFGLRRCLPWMVAAINLPNVVYLALAWWQPENLWAVYAAVGVEQIGYGFGFAAFMLYMLYFSRGDHETAHYAICTGFMALGLFIPGWFSGRIEAALGFTGFFTWIMVATIPSFVVAAIVYSRIDPNFGRREAA